MLRVRWGCKDRLLAVCSVLASKLWLLHFVAEHGWLAHSSPICCFSGRFPACRCSEVELLLQRLGQIDQFLMSCTASLFPARLALLCIAALCKLLLQQTLAIRSPPLPAPICSQVPRLVLQGSTSSQLLVACTVACPYCGTYIYSITKPRGVYSYKQVPGSMA